MLGVAGFIIFKDDKDHETNNFEASFIKTTKMNETNNVRTEIKGIILALQTLGIQFLEYSSDVTLFTDCNAVVNLVGRRASLEANKYISKKSKSVLANADIYKELFELFDKFKPKIIWVKGHSPQKENDLIQKNFSFIDRLVRKKLRTALLIS